MTLNDIATKLSLEVYSARHRLSNEVTGGYASDLLSCVIARARAGNVWVTLQAHENIVVVAVMLDLAGIIVTERTKLDQVTLARAEKEEIPILGTAETTFTVVGRLASLGIRGPEQTLT